VVDCPASRRLSKAETRETTGQRLKEMSRTALVETLETTLMVMEAETAKPRESVTVRVSVWTLMEEGAVQVVVAAVVSEKVPPVVLQARVRASPVLGSWTAAVRESEAPAWTEVEEATRESMKGASLAYGGGGATSWSVRATAVVWLGGMETPEAEPWKSRVPEASKA
jgi:hypothetical protein